VTKPPKTPTVGTESDGELRKFLAEHYVSNRAQIDGLLAGRVRDYINRKYDPDLGYVFWTGRFRHGLDGAICDYNFDSFGARRGIAHADRPCRVNTYGDSFTFGDQVSDGETWQEQLAAHLGEPIRNYGVGNYSVYQAYLRMRREEARTPAKYIIFNIYDDDHFRSLRPFMAQGSSWGARPYVTVNACEERFEEHPNPCPTPASYCKLCDLDWVHRTFQGNEELELLLGLWHARQGTPEKSYATVRELARRRGLGLTIDSKESLLTTIKEVETRDALFSSMRIVELVDRFAAEQGKAVLYVLSYGADCLRQNIKDHGRFDQSFVDFLHKRGLPFVDMMDIHSRDFGSFKTSPDEYLSRFHVRNMTTGSLGHYSRFGNAFLAFAIKSKLVALMDPKPPAYDGSAYIPASFVL
jgi:hypothetical protein